MKTFRILVASILIVALPMTLLASDGSYGVKYDGGSVPQVKPGADLKLFIDPTGFRFLKNKAEVLNVPAVSITEITYGQDVHRRVGTAIGLAVVSLGVGALMALSKSKKHFVGVTWDAGNGQKGGFAIQCDKNEYRGILAGLEGISGKKAVDASTLTVKN